MRISDWSSDVCSSDLAAGRPEPADIQIQGQPKWTANAGLNLRYPEKVLGGDLSASLDFHYTGATRQVELTIPSYKKFDMRDGKSVVEGKSGSVRVDLVGRSSIKKKKNIK